MVQVVASNRVLAPLAAPALVAHRREPEPQGHFYSTVGNVMRDKAVIVTLNVDGLAASSNAADRRRRPSPLT